MRGSTFLEYDVEELEGRQVVVAVEVRQREAHRTPAELEAGAELDALRARPRDRAVATSPAIPSARDAVAPERRGLQADEPDRVGLAAASEVDRLEVVEVHRELEAHVLERPDVVERPDPADRPERDPALLEARKRRERDVDGIELIGGAEELGLPPDDVLLAGPDPEPRVEHLDVEVGLLQLPLVLARAVVPLELGLAEVLVERVELVEMAAKLRRGT